MINVAVVGCGYWGPNLVRTLSENKNFCLKWCCDLKKSRLEVLKFKYPAAKLTTDFTDIVKDKEVDAVAVATPLLTHHTIAKKFLLAGKHVLLEKPFTHSAKSAEELLRISKNRKRVLMVGYTYLYSPAVRKIKNIISSGGIGNVHYIHSTRVHFGHLRPAEGVMWDLASHDIAILIYWFGLSMYNISCIGKDCLKRGYLDTAYLTINFKHEPAAYIFTSLLAPIKMRNMIITGSKKMIFYNDTRNVEKIKIYDQCAIMKGSENIARQGISYRDGNIFSPNIDFFEPLATEIEDFAKCIEYHKIPKSDGLLGLRVVEILEAAERSLKYNKVVKINK